MRHEDRVGPATAKETISIDCSGSLSSPGTTCPETRLHVMNKEQASTLAKIKVMEAFARGKDVQRRRHLSEENAWIDTDDPGWAWGIYNYRIKPKEPRTFYVNEYDGYFGQLRTSKEDVDKAGAKSRKGLVTLVEVLDE